MRVEPCRPGIIRRVLDRPRIITLSWAALFLAIFGALAWAVTQERAPLGALDDLGRRLEDWADEHDTLREVLRFVEVWFNTLPLAVATLVLVVLLLVRGHRRAAVYAVLVTVSTYLVTTLVKASLGRTRPEWQDPIDIVQSRSYPSGHTSLNAALMAVVCVLALMFIRRSSMRRVVYVVAGLVVLLIWADRVLLGRHFPTDVLGGTVLAIGLALFWLAVYSPLPRSHAAHAEPLHEAVPSSRQLAVILNPSKLEDVASFRTIVSAMAEESGWSSPTWLYTTIEDPGTGHGRVGGRLGRRPGDGLRRATARCAPSAPSSPAPASLSGSCLRAPATCWLATSRSRCSCGPRSTSPSTARTAPSTWSR